MARTIQAYSDRTRVFDDIDLLIVMSMIIETIKDHKNENIYAGLQQTVDDWEWVIEGYGPGIMEFGLDERLSERIVRAAFLSVLQDVRTRLKSFGEWVPLEFVNGLIMFPLMAKTTPREKIIISQAQPAGRLLKVVRDLEELVSSSD